MPPDWRDELLEGTTDEIQKGWGRLAPRRKHRAALPWIKLLVRGSREDTNEEQCDKSRSSSSPRTTGRCAEAATQAGCKHQLPFHAGSLGRGQTSLHQGLWAKALVQATALATFTTSFPSTSRSGSTVLLFFIGGDRRHRWAEDRIFKSLMALANSHSRQDKGC